MTTSLILPALIMLPLVGAVLVFLLGSGENKPVGLFPLGITVVEFILAARLTVLTAQAGRIVQQIGSFALESDAIAVLLILVFSGIFLTIMLFTVNLLQAEISPQIVPHYYGVSLILLAALMAVTMSNDLFNMYIFLEVVSVCAAVLVAAKGDREALAAAARYLLLSMLASALVLMGIAGLYGTTGHTELAKVRQALHGAISSYALPVYASTALLVVGTAVKAALFPLHSWLPYAHGSAATPSSVVISGLLVKVNIVFLLKVLTQVFPMDFTLALPVRPILLVLSTAAILGGSLMALRQTDIKRMLAYSTAAQVGYIFLGLGLMNETALVGSLFHILNHAVVKGMLVLAAGSIMKLTGRRKIADFAGVGRRFPLPMVVFTIGALSMVGIPPLSGFVSKWYLGLGALDGGQPVLVAVLLMSSLLNAFYYLPIVIAAFFRSGTNIEQQHMELPAGAKVSMLVLAAACIVIGLFASRAVEFLEPAVYQLFQGGA